MFTSLIVTSCAEEEEGGKVITSPIGSADPDADPDSGNSTTGIWDSGIWDTSTWGD